MLCNVNRILIFFSDQYHTTFLIPLILMQTPMSFYATKMIWQETLVLLGAGALVILINLLGHLSLNMQEMMSLRPRYISKYLFHISKFHILLKNNCAWRKNGYSFMYPSRPLLTRLDITLACVMISITTIQKIKGSHQKQIYVQVLVDIWTIRYIPTSGPIVALMISPIILTLWILGV